MCLNRSAASISLSSSSSLKFVYMMALQFSIIVNSIFGGRSRSASLSASMSFPLIGDDDCLIICLYPSKKSLSALVK